MGIEKLNQNPYIKTTSELLQLLEAEGYTYDFKLDEDCIKCDIASLKLPPEDFEIVKVFRFEGATNPSDQEVVYVIESQKHDVKGYIMDAYGPDASPLSTAMVEKLKTH